MIDNLRGSLWMVAAMAGFAVEDMFLKSVAASLPVGQILMIFGAGGMMGFALLAMRRGERILHPAILSPAILIRCLFEVAGRLFYTLAIALTPLSSASAILQATPLVVVMGAALVFGERVGWRRWAAIAVGFAGVLIILRPGLDGFTPLSLLAVLGMLGFAGRDLATRAAPPVLSNLQLGVYGFAMMVPTGALLLAVSGGAVLPSALAAGQLAAATVIGVLAYYALTSAMRIGEVSVVTPFRYTRLVFALILGATVFGERPDAATLLGSAVIVTSGIYTLLRSRRVQAMATKAGPGDAKLRQDRT
jgi:drug/metabolite transporter (DMT)-like permease